MVARSFNSRRFDRAHFDAGRGSGFGNRVAMILRLGLVPLGLALLLQAVLFELLRVKRLP